MKHKISELEDALLDAAVALAEGAPKRPYGAQEWIEVLGGKALWFTDDGNGSTSSFRPWLPSSSWRDGGPIIDKARMSIGPRFVDGEWRGEWKATCFAWFGEKVEYAECLGPDPLIAAMRAYVASKFGDTVELPA